MLPSNYILGSLLWAKGWVWLSETWTDKLLKQNSYMTLIGGAYDDACISCTPIKVMYMYVTVTVSIISTYVHVQLSRCTDKKYLVTLLLPHLQLRCTSMQYADSTQVVITSTNEGAVSFTNSAFWGPSNQIAKVTFNT